MTLAACNAEQKSAPGTVNAGDYTAFYLWSGVAPPPALGQAESVYLLWGEVRQDDPDRVVPLRRTAPEGTSTARNWLVIRAERLDWGEGAYQQLANEARRWQMVGRLEGVQVDFDSTTGGLGDYAAFLSRLRQRLPDRLKLSATGLMDWPANASEADLAALRGALDEIVIQTYQDRSTLADYPRYLINTQRLAMPYRIALIEGGEWSPPAHLAQDPDFRGYVVFLLSEPSIRSRRSE